jgi:hypothetical protein
MVSQQAGEVNEAAAELTAIARELEGTTARFKITRDDEAVESVPSAVVADRATAAGSPRRKKAA